MVVLIVGVTACGSESGGGGSVQSEPSQAGSQPGEVACGQPFELPAASELRLTARFPKSAPAGEQTLSGSVEVTSEKALHAVAATAAGAFLVRDGRVVTTPLAQDAMGVRWAPAAGEKKRVPALASLMSCEQGGGPLAPGDYELYAQFVLTPDDGAPITGYGGPLALRVG
jgi:hypothetical protein